MSRGDRGKWIAFGIVALSILAFGLAACLIVYTRTLESSYRQNAHSAAEYYAARGYVVAETNCSEVTLANAMGCEEDAHERAHSSKRDEYDLEAQRVTAAWAAATGIAACIGMAFSIVGVLLVWLTFQEQRETNILSKIEADKAERNHRIANAPYVHPAECILKIDPADGHKAISIRFRNVGASPAVNVLFCAALTFEPVKKSKRYLNIFCAGKREIMLSPIAPNDERRGSIMMTKPEIGHIAGLEGKGKWWVVRGTIRWRDISGAHYRTDFVFRNNTLKARPLRFPLLHCDAPAYQEVDDQGQPIEPAKA